MTPQQNFLNVAAPAFGLDWGNELHTIALETVMREHVGTKLERDTLANDAFALIKLITLTSEKVEAAQVIRRMFFQGDTRLKGWI